MTVTVNVEATHHAPTAPSTPTESDATRQAKAEVQRVFDAEIALSRQWQSQRGALAAAETAAGDVVLDAQLNGGGRSKQAIAHVSELQNSVAATVRAIAAARHRRRVLITAVWEAQAADWRAGAAELFKQADALEAEIRPLLEQLENLTGAEYRPTRELKEMQTGQTRREIFGGPDAMLRGQASEWNRRAQQIAAGKIQEQGEFPGVRIDDVDAIIQAIEDLGCMQIAPALPGVIEWAETAVEREHLRRKQVPRTSDNWRPVDAPVYSRVSWRDAKLRHDRGQAVQ